VTTAPAVKPGTGTIYRLVDPRDHETRYIGQTVQPLPTRLSGHYGKSSKSPKVRAWVAELKASGLKPLIEPVSENVPADQLLAAERAEITRLILAGRPLLNELSTAEGRELARLRDQRDHEAAEMTGWRELAAVAMDVLGGPVPPGDLPGFAIPEETWKFWSQVTQGYAARKAEMLRRGDYDGWNRMDREQREAVRFLWFRCRGSWGELRGIASDSFDRRMQHLFASAIEVPCATRQQGSKLLALMVWYTVAVQPWRHLAELGGIALDDSSFIGWCGGQDPGVREALLFLASADPKMIGRLSVRVDDPRFYGPGHYLAAVAAAYSSAIPALAIQSQMKTVLGRCAQDHEMTQPMADLLVRIDQKALDSAFGADIGADIDRDLHLSPGTAGRVMLALVDPGRLGHISDPNLQKAADRATQTLPVTDLPDYGGWHGYGIVGARAVAACLVRAGLGESKWKPSDEYLAHHQALWLPKDC